MSKVAQYLQEHLAGEVSSAVDVRRYFSTDGSILSITPSVVVYPRNEGDVRKTARFTWQLAERGRIIPITARGAGTNQAGAAIGNGIMMAFPAHMNRIIEFDGKNGTVIVEPGITFGKLQQALHTHGRFLPPYPATLEYSTVGGAIANNASGEKSYKYGDMRKYVKSLRVVLANGEVIETSRISKREVSKKLGLSTFEGEIYRGIDVLFEENGATINGQRPKTTKNSAGYDLWDVKRKDGSIDLTPLFVGSQGTLGIIAEATLKTEPHNPETTVIAALIDDIKIAEQVTAELDKLPGLPSMVEMVDENLLQFINHQNPSQLKGLLPDDKLPKLVMLIEFDQLNSRIQKRMVKKTQKILDKLQVSYRTETEELLKQQLWKVRHSPAAVLAHSEGNIRALPFIEDGVVPPARFSEYLQGIYTLLDKYKLPSAVWGHMGDANLHVQPLLDLSEVGDRQRLFRLMDEYYSMVIQLGGSTSGGSGDGRVRAPYLTHVYGAQMYELFQKVKLIFDPHGILNTGVKVNVSLDDIKPILRQEYTNQHLFEYMPRS